MTYPPAPGMPEQPQPYGGQGQPGGQPGGYPGAPQGAGWDPSGQYGSTGQYGSGPYNSGQPGYPGGPQKNKTGLIVGLSILGVAVVGGIVALILILTNKEDPAPVAAAPTESSGSQAPSSAAKPPTGGSPGGGLPGGGAPGGQAPGAGAVEPAPAGQPSPQALGDYLVSAIKSGDSAKYYAARCGGGNGNIPKVDSATIEQPPTATGPTGQLSIRVTGADPNATGLITFTINQSSSGWCWTKAPFKKAGS